MPRVTPRRAFIFISILTAVLLAAHFLTATFGVRAVRAAIPIPPYQSISNVEIWTLFPGLIRCTYYERRAVPAGPEEGGRFYESDFLWYGFGCVRIRHVLTAVS